MLCSHTSWGMAAVLAAVTISGGMTGCGNDAPIDVSRNLSMGGTYDPCRAERIELRQKAMRELGLNVMDRRMRKIAQEISPAEKEDLSFLTQQLSREDLKPRERARFRRSIAHIYSKAIEDAGIDLGESERFGRVGRRIKAEPSFSGITGQERLSVLVSEPTSVALKQKAGAITEIYLVPAADPSRYEFVLMQTQTAAPGANGGEVAASVPVTLSEYVQSQLPATCPQL
jgi:hypothetical protein